MAEMNEGTRYRGWVRSFRDTWGFINAEGFQGDLFVGLKGNLHLQSLAKDDTVEFEVRRDDKGKPEAINVVVVGRQGGLPAPSPHSSPGSLQAGILGGGGGCCGGGARAEVGHLVGQQLVGRIKSFRDSWGFIQSDSFVGDLFVHKKSNADLGPVGSGDPVSFTVAEDGNASGGFQAVNVAILQEDITNLMGQTVHGWVKSFKDNWGLLNSSRFEGDIFVGMKNNKHLPAMSLTVGASVEFEVAPDDKGAKGVQAVKVKLVSGGPPGVAQQLTMAASARQGMIPGFGIPKPEALVGRRCQGIIRSFKEDWGFVISSSFEGDLFVHKGSNQHIGVLKPGDAVIFDIGLQSSGKCHALNVQAASLPAARGLPLGGACAQAASPFQLGDLVGQRCTGSVRSFDGTWGFANSPRFIGDLFVGLKSNPHLTGLSKGDQIEFVVRSSGSKSQTGFEAVQVQVLGAGPFLGAGPVLASSGGLSRSRSPRPLQQQQQQPARGLRGTGSRSAASMVGATLSGWVRSFKGDWGFINSPSFDGDLFVGSKSNTHLGRDLAANDQVMFQVAVGPGGKAEALDVQVLGP
mmetsp:Transcript_48531/g.127974  ORF Transcript_48531/g.127974 Transcript_48531/m.127974 type:complete len:576 (+) Transcript_48531:117-1844(+)